MIGETIEFQANGRKIKFSIAHDMIDSGVTTESAIENWAARTNEITVESFCEYVKSKGMTCVPIKDTRASDGGQA